MTEVPVSMPAMIANLISIQDMISVRNIVSIQGMTSIQGMIFIRSRLPIAVMISIRFIDVAQIVLVIAWSLRAIRSFGGFLGFVHGSVTGKIIRAVILRLLTMTASGRAGVVSFLIAASPDCCVFGMRIASGCVVLARMTVSILF